MKKKTLEKLLSKIDERWELAISGCTSYEVIKEADRRITGLLSIIRKRRDEIQDDRAIVCGMLRYNARHARDYKIENP